LKIPLKNSSKEDLVVFINKNTANGMKYWLPDCKV
jgi:hypothetical protein